MIFATVPIAAMGFVHHENIVTQNANLAKAIDASYTRKRGKYALMPLTVCLHATVQVIFQMSNGTQIWQTLL